MKIAFRVDANARVGGGHAMRCLTLADELRARGAETLFIGAAIPPALADRVRRAGHQLRLIEPPDGLERAGEDWDRYELAPEAQALDAKRTLAGLGDAVEWLVVDHYLLGAAWHAAARGGTQRLMVIDDLANRPLDCDLLLDQTLGRAPDEYAPFVPRDARMLLGSNYALLRPEFARERPAALARRRQNGPVRRILLSLGTTDPGGITGDVLAAILTVAGACSIDVVLGTDASSLERVCAIAAKHPQVRYHVDSSDMAELMRDADLAVGAGGTTSWERCCLGLPTVTLALAANQAGVQAALTSAGASDSADPGSIGTRVGNLLADSDALGRMSAAAFAIVDGEGAARVVDLLCDAERARVTRPPVLRPAAEPDGEMLWLWRNDPATRAQSRTRESIAWQDHTRWLAATLDDDTRQLLIAEIEDGPVGMVRFDWADGGNSAEVSINIRPDQRGSGLGAAILNAACCTLDAQHVDTVIVAHVNDRNQSSRRLFEHCGFVRSGDSDAAGFSRYTRGVNASGSRKSA